MGGDDSGRRLLRLRREAFKLYSPPVTAAAESGDNSNIGVNGTMLVRIFSALGLFPPESRDHDMYCVVGVDSLGYAATDVISGSVSFDWDDQFLVDLRHARTLTFSVYHWTAHAQQRRRHRLCFTASVGLRRLAAVDRHHQLYLRLEPNGELYVELDYRDQRESLRRTPSVDADSVFGNDLESLVRRERTGSGVPVVVRRCVEQVERSGMQQVGVYRVCGSFEKVTCFRERVEARLDADELFGNGVDVNVVTGNY